MLVQTSDVSPDVRCQSRHPMSVQASDVSADIRCQSTHLMSVRTPDESPDARCQSRHPMSIQTPNASPAIRCQSTHPMSVHTPRFRSTLTAGDAEAFSGKNKTVHDVPFKHSLFLAHRGILCGGCGKSCKALGNEHSCCD